MIKKQLLDLLYQRYGTLVLSRKQTAESIGISTASLDRMKRLGLGPRYIKKMAQGKNGSVSYPLDTVVDYIMLERNKTM